jgi:hypothetical protein
MRIAILLPAYADAKGMRPYLDEAEYAEAVADRRFVLERLTYASDGLPVVAYAYGPRDAVTRLPTVVFSRGSYVQPEVAHQLLPLFHRLAERGFAVVAPMLRGSAGAPGLDEMGGDDLHDLLNTRGLVDSLAFADSANLFLYGESRGGMMTFLAIKAGYPARSAATFGALTDLGALMAAQSSQRARRTRGCMVPRPPGSVNGSAVSGAAKNFQCFVTSAGRNSTSLRSRDRQSVGFCASTGQHRHMIGQLIVAPPLPSLHARRSWRNASRIARGRSGEAMFVSHAWSWWSWLASLCVDTDTVIWGN